MVVCGNPASLQCPHALPPTSFVRTRVYVPGLCPSAPPARVSATPAPATARVHPCLAAAKS